MRHLEKAISDRLTPVNIDKSRNKNILILGIGNYLMGDEGVGVQFIHHLIRHNIHYDNADLVDGGVGGFALMGYFDEYEHIVFIDATMDGRPSGTISLIEPKFASDFPKALSAHDFGLKDMVESMYILGKVPKMYLFTVSIPSIKPMCLELSHEVKSSIPALQQRVSYLVDSIQLQTT